MQNLERYLLWGAIIVLFILFFWPRSSMYTGEPKSITKLAEFAPLNDDIKRLYNDHVLRVIQAVMTTFNKWWMDIPVDKKSMIIAELKRVANEKVSAVESARAKNGSDVFQEMMGLYLQVSTTPGSPGSVTSNASVSPSPGSVTSNASVSTYMMEPFMPMRSGFSLEDTLNKVLPKTSGFSLQDTLNKVLPNFSS